MRHQVRQVTASEAERLDALLSGKKINALLKDYDFVEGEAMKVEEDALRVDVTKSSNPRMVPTGVRDIPIERISTVRWTEGSKNRKILFTVGLVTGIVGGLWIAGSEGSLDGTKVLGLIGTTAGGGLLGYTVGWRMDQGRITFTTHRPVTGVHPK